MTTTLLNPFSVRLKKHPFMEMRGEPVYINGNYRIYHYGANHFVYTFKNIVITERGGKNIPLIDNLVKGIKPTGEAALYHDYDRLKVAINDGHNAAKRLEFEIK